MDIFKGLFWYAYKDNPIHWVTLKVDQVNEIIEINKQNKKVESLEMYASELKFEKEENISFGANTFFAWLFFVDMNN